MIVFILIVNLYSSLSVQNMEQEFYYLKVSSSNAEVTCLLNGFPVYWISSKGQVANQLPVNLALTGKDNKLLVFVKALDENATVKGSVALYKSGEVVATDDERANVAEFTIDASREQERQITFDNEQFDFTEIIKNTPVVTDTALFREYGMKLKAMVDQRDIDKLLEHMAPKVRDYAVAYSVPEETIRESLKQSFTGDMFNVAWDEVRSEDITPVAYCDGRIWELTTLSGHPLFYAATEEGEISLPVYVAEVNGELRVVR